MNSRLYANTIRLKQFVFFGALLLVLLGATTAYAASDNTLSNTAETKISTSYEGGVQTPELLGTTDNNTEHGSNEPTAAPAPFDSNVEQSEVKGSNNSSSSVSVKIDSNVSSKTDPTNVSNPGDVSVEINGENVAPDSRGRIRERYENENTESSIRVDIDDDSESSSDITFDISVEGETKDVRR